MRGWTVEVEVAAKARNRQDKGVSRPPYRRTYVMPRHIMPCHVLSSYLSLFLVVDVTHLYSHSLYPSPPWQLYPHYHGQGPHYPSFPQHPGDPSSGQDTPHV